MKEQLFPSSAWTVDTATDVVVKTELAYLEDVRGVMLDAKAAFEDTCQNQYWELYLDKRDELHQEVSRLSSGVDHEA